MDKRTVWKFLVPFRDDLAVLVPQGGRLVYCGADPESGDPALWIEVSPNSPLEAKQFLAVATGSAYQVGAAYIGNRR